MKFYAERRIWRVRQITGDVAVAIWSAIWIRIGMGVDSLINRLQAPGRFFEAAGNDFAANFDSIADRVVDLPIVGEDVQAPFSAAAGAGRSFAQAAQTQQEIVHTIAFVLGLLFALIPIVLILVHYAPGRIRWIREASAAAKLRIDAADLELFALRAVATRPLYELQRVCPDPAAALAARDFEALANLELNALGLSSAA